MSEGAGELKGSIPTGLLFKIGDQVRLKSDLDLLDGDLIVSNHKIPAGTIGYVASLQFPTGIVMVRFPAETWDQFRVVGVDRHRLEHAPLMREAMSAQASEPFKIGDRVRLVEDYVWHDTPNLAVTIPAGMIGDVRMVRIGNLGQGLAAVFGPLAVTLDLLKLERVPWIRYHEKPLKANPVHIDDVVDALHAATNAQLRAVAQNGREPGDVLHFYMREAMKPFQAFCIKHNLPIDFSPR